MKMKWKDYEKSLVKRYGVQLVGWPRDFPFDIEKLREDDLKLLNKALDNETCRWVRVTIEETEARLADEAASGDVDKLPRKRRSDMGKKRKATDGLHVAMKRPKGVPLPVESPDTDDEDSSNDSGIDSGDSDSDSREHDSESDEESDGNDGSGGVSDDNK